MTATTPPGPPQHLCALAKANEVRFARAALKKRVRREEITAAEVILDVPPEAATMEVSVLLMSQQRWGRKRSRKLLLSIPMSENKKIGSMTERQRRAIAATLTHEAAKARALAPRPELLEGALA